jgi:hypothetical protein
MEPSSAECLGASPTSDTSNISLQSRIASIRYTSAEHGDLKGFFVKTVWPKLAPDYEDLVGEVQKICREELERQRIEFWISGRVKKAGSIEKSIKRREKTQLSRGGRGYECVEDIFRAVHDLAGVRIVLRFDTDEEAVKELIRKRFEFQDETEFPNKLLNLHTNHNSEVTRQSTIVSSLEAKTPRCFRGSQGCCSRFS